MKLKPSNANRRHRYVIETPVETPDGQGGFSVTWQVFAEVWGSLETSSRNEINFAEGIRPVGEHKIVIRWIDGLTEKMRLRLNSTPYLTRTFQINGIEWIEGTRFDVLLRCRENVGS